MIIGFFPFTWTDGPALIQGANSPIGRLLAITQQDRAIEVTQQIRILPIEEQDRIDENG